MYGQNQVTGTMYQANGSLLVNEVFYTLQGEGPDIGRPAIFIRLSKCNLRCYFCDTEFERASVISTADLVARVEHIRFLKQGCELVVITGGEPLLQQIVPLITSLQALGFEVAIETAGTVCPPGMHATRIICSPKTPRLNPDIIPLITALKYVIRAGHTSGVDGLPIMSTQTEGAETLIFRPRLMPNPVPVYVSPMDEGDPERNAVNLECARGIALRFGYRLTIQLHKMKGVELP